MTATCTRIFPARDYDLAATFTSGQAFRWEAQGNAWVGVVGTRWVRLEPGRLCIKAETTEPVANWSWLEGYLQLGLDLEAVLQTFPG